MDHLRPAAYAAHQLPIGFGNTVKVLNGQHVLAESQGGEAGHYYGVIGPICCEVLRASPWISGPVHSAYRDNCAAMDNSYRPCAMLLG